MEKKVHNKSKIIEIVWLSVFGTIWFIGFIFGILGLFAFNIEPVTTNPLYIAQRAFGTMMNMGLVDFRIFGAILMLVSMIVMVIVLYYYANKHDTIKITKQRREKMLKDLLDANAFSISPDEEANADILPNDTPIPTAEETTAKIN